MTYGRMGKIGEEEGEIRNVCLMRVILNEFKKWTMTVFAVKMCYQNEGIRKWEN